MTMRICSVADCGRSAERKSSGKRGFCSMHYSRFLKHGDPLRVDRTPSPAKDWIAAHVSHSSNDCLPWPFAAGPDGYGRVHRKNSGPITTASHMMCEAAHGPRPSERHEAAHSCGRGNIGCVNPTHLYWATPRQNQMDRVSHGTSNRGSQQHLAKLTDEDVRSIRALAGTKRVFEIAALFGLHPSTVSQIIARKRWAWLV